MPRTTPTEHLGPSRSRRAPRPSGGDRELAILDTAERLLGERSLRDISVDDLTKSVGISRPAFYFYFPSKDAVLLTLLDRVAAKSFASADRGFAPDSDEPVQQWRNGIAAAFQFFNEHRAVVRAAIQVKGMNPDVQQLWSAILQRWVHRTTKGIEAERRRGAAPPGIPASDLSIALNLMNERTMSAISTDDQPALAECDLVEVLLQVWLSSIYLTTNPPSYTTLPIVRRPRE
jgi:AcrR family transcriptional regulator